jgi:hypothetical protein
MGQQPRTLWVFQITEEKRNQRILFIALFLTTALAVSVCGPSPEQIATRTAAAWTPTIA